MKHKLIALMLAGVIALGTAACTSDSGNGGTVTVGITQEPSVFDPHTMVAAGDKEIMFNVFEGLYKFDSNGNLNPCLATAVEISDDSTVYTFDIREGVKFHNGNDMTTDDVVYSLKRAAGLLDGQDGALVTDLDGITDVTADGNKVKVTLDAPNSELLSYFTVAIIPDEVADINATPVGTGPFVFGSYTIGQDVTLLRNDNYWKSGLPYIDKAVFKITADMDAGLIELQNGSIDIYPYLTTDRANQLDPAAFNVLKKGSNMVQIFALNNKVKPLDDQRVREAICYAISRDDIISVTMEGAGEPLTTAMSPAMGSYYDTSLDGTYTRDIEKAKALLAEAGYPNGFDITITVPSNYLVHVNTAVELKSELAAAGINCTINQVDWATWLSDTYTDRNYETTVIALTSNYAPYDVLNRYQTDNSGNFINYSNARVDEILAQIPLETDDAVKTGLYHEILRLMLDDAASCYIQDPANTVAVSTKISGYNLYPMYVQDLSEVKFN
ncbi:peptide/nickel transport system substrate-binding protein [Ruminococcaceae bacterium YRB3002]|nr:peptide/nickel transport system substrate-binding protein [Ruminococcaceae bacterium YRB3002]